MNLKQKIILERVTKPEQLSPAEREQVHADRRLAQLIAENRGLAGLSPTAQPVPDREAMLGRVHHELENRKETRMTLISRLLAGKPWYVQAAAAVALLLALGAVTLLPRGTSWASSEGYALVFDFGQVSSADEELPSKDEIMERLSVLEDALKDWKDNRATQGEDDLDANCLMLNVNVDQERLTATLGLVTADDELLEELRVALADVAGLPEPTVTSATWFYDKLGGPPDCGAGIILSLKDHRFAFPPGATEQEIEGQINAWLKAENPEGNEQVDVVITQEGDRTRIKVLLRSEDEE